MITMESMRALSALYMPGWPEMIIFGVIALVIFGPKRLPALSRSLGKSITDFKKGLHDIKDDISEAGREAEAQAEEEAKAKSLENSTVEKKAESAPAEQAPSKD